MKINTSILALVTFLRDQLRAARRYLKSRAPFVRRRLYRQMQQRYELVADALSFDHAPASAAHLEIRKPLAPEAGTDEICLFVTHADRPQLRAHVVHHVACLVAQGFKVVLIINTDLPPQTMAIDAATLELASAAWGHAYVLGDGFPQCQRLLLVNDSIVGPLSVEDYAKLIARLRTSTADVIGLLENFRPNWHIQSFFLAFNARVLADARFKKLFSNILSFRDKATVITVYELSLARQLQAMGFQCEALFPARYRDERSGDETWGHWQELIDAGFPFVKGVIVRHPKRAQAIAARVPAAFIASLTGS